MTCNHTSSRGIITLLSVTAISLVLLVLMVSISLSGWHTRFRVIQSEAKVQSELLAQSCLNYVAIRIISDSAFGGDTTVSNTRGSCYISPVLRHVPIEGSVTLGVQAIVMDTHTNAQLVLSVNDISIDLAPDVVPSNGSENLNLEVTAWREVPTL